MAFQLKTFNFLTGEELSRDELAGLLDYSVELKKTRDQGSQGPRFPGKHLALFEKPSLRTRMSFSIAMSELGGSVVESLTSTSKREEPEDMVRVLAGYVDSVMLRTHGHDVLERMAKVSSIPIINGLSDSHHPCQALADLMTLKQRFGKLQGLKLAYVGDGNNVLHSLLLLAPFLGVHLSYACPEGYEPDAMILRRAHVRASEGGGSISSFVEPEPAVKGAHAVYTDVWTSMGFEGHEGAREEAFEKYQLNESLYALASPGALVMHCLPMLRGKEISDAMADHPCSALFAQSENRLHVQKALLVALLPRSRRGVAPGAAKAV